MAGSWVRRRIPLFSQYFLTAAQVVEGLARRGFIVNAPRPDTLRLAPPLILSDVDADAFTAALDEVLTERLPEGAR